MKTSKLKLFTLILIITVFLMTTTGCDNQIKEMHILTVQVVGEGTVKVNDSKVSSIKEFNLAEGTLLHLNSQAEEEWKFHNWQGDIEGTDQDFNLEINDDKEIIAVFAPEHITYSERASFNLISLKIGDEKIPLNFSDSYSISEDNNYDITAFVQNTGFRAGEDYLKLKIRDKNDNLVVEESTKLSLEGLKGKTIRFENVTSNLREKDSPFNVKIATWNSFVSGQFIVDGTSPIVNIKGISPDYLAENDKLIINYEIYDELSGMDNIDLIIENKNGLQLIDYLEKGAQNKEYTLSDLEKLGSVKDGSYNIIIEALDKVGNMEMDFIKDAFYIDTTKPNPEIISPTITNPVYIKPDSYVNVDFKIGEDNLKKAELKVDKYSDYLGYADSSYEKEGLPKGTESVQLYAEEGGPERFYNLTLTVFDQADNQNKITIENAIGVDDTPPNYSVTDIKRNSSDLWVLNKNELRYMSQVMIYYQKDSSEWPGPAKENIIVLTIGDDYEIKYQLSEEEIENSNRISMNIPSNAFSEDGIYNTEAKIIDQACNYRSSFKGPSVIVDTTRPEVVSAEVTAVDEVIIKMSEPLNPGQKPPPDGDIYHYGSFNILVEGNNLAHSKDISISNNLVIIKIDPEKSRRSISKNSNVKITYWPEPEHLYHQYSFEDKAGNLVQHFEIEAENNI